MEKSILEKRFSVGLCLGESIEDIELFLEKYHRYLNSIYFSVPLGRKFYSRAKLSDEYDGNEEKLIHVLKCIRSRNIRLELTLNTRDLTAEEIKMAIDFCAYNDVIPEEIVCLKEYGEVVRGLLPNCEIKYSFNNHDVWLDKVDKNFDTVIIGKGLLRDTDKLGEVVKEYNVTYMLNNGCSFICNGRCGAGNCKNMFEADIKLNGLEYVYARSSIFPSELKYLITQTDYANQLKFKISNRPWGLQFTRDALDAYISMEDSIDEWKTNRNVLRVFCATVPISERLDEIDLDEVIEYKKHMELCSERTKNEN